MSFDSNKVQFDVAELDAAKAADSVYELFADAIADGLDLSDLMAIPAAVPHVMHLYGYLADGTKADYAKKLIALGVCLLRDNSWLDGLDEEE